MDHLYIIDPNNFKGNCLNTMPVVEKALINETIVHYTDQTFEQYNKENGGNLVAVDWDEFEREYYTPFLNGLCGKFKRTTKERFWDGLECLPPKRWTQFDGGEFFFVGECYTGNLYTCYVRKGNKYYTALRPINSKAVDLIELK